MNQYLQLQDKFVVPEDYKPRHDSGFFDHGEPGYEVGASLRGCIGTIIDPKTIAPRSFDFYGDFPGLRQHWWFSYNEVIPVNKLRIEEEI